MVGISELLVILKNINKIMNDSICKSFMLRIIKIIISISHSSRLVHQEGTKLFFSIYVYGKGY